jgi:hypothetical protein
MNGILVYFALLECEFFFSEPSGARQKLFFYVELTDKMGTPLVLSQAIFWRIVYEGCFIWVEVYYCTP